MYQNSIALLCREDIKLTFLITPPSWLIGTPEPSAKAATPAEFKNALKSDSERIVLIMIFVTDSELCVPFLVGKFLSSNKFQASEKGASSRVKTMKLTHFFKSTAAEKDCGLVE
jgi:hypothetical protein